MNKLNLFFITMLILGGIIGGCAFTPPSIHFPDKPKLDYQFETHEVSIPKFLIGEEGKKVVSNQVEHHTYYHYNTQAKTLSILEKFQNLGFWFILILVLAFLLFPTGTAMFLYNNYIKYKNATKEIVASIKESKVIDEHPKLHDSLVANTSNVTKTVIGKIKSNLK